MILSPAPNAYSQADQTRLRQTLREADAENVKRGRNIEVGAASIILTDSAGIRWAITVDTSGNLSTVAA